MTRPSQESRSQAGQQQVRHEALQAHVPARGLLAKGRDNPGIELDLGRRALLDSGFRRLFPLMPERAQRGPLTRYPREPFICLPRAAARMWTGLITLAGDRQLRAGYPRHSFTDRPGAPTAASLCGGLYRAGRAAQWRAPSRRFRAGASGLGNFRTGDWTRRFRTGDFRAGASALVAWHARLKDSTARGLLADDPPLAARAACRSDRLTSGARRPAQGQRRRGRARRSDSARGRALSFAIARAAAAGLWSESEPLWRSLVRYSGA